MRDRLQAVADGPLTDTQLDTLSQVVLAVDQIDELAVALTSAVEAVRTGLGYPHVGYWQLDQAGAGDNHAGGKGGQLRLVTAAGATGVELPSVAGYAYGVGLPGRAWQRGELMVVPDLGDLADCGRARAAKAGGLRGGLGVPILNRGRCVGVLECLGGLTEADLDAGLDAGAARFEVLRTIGVLLGQAVERHDATAHANRLATTLRELVEEVRTVDNALGAVAIRAVTTHGLIEGVGRSGAEASAVLRTIGSIAAQTSLLALNATIEADRAGEIGRHLALAAAEFRQLAEQASAATGEADLRISAIQVGTTHALAGITAITEAVEAVNWSAVEVIARYWNAVDTDRPLGFD